MSNIDSIYQKEEKFKEYNSPLNALLLAKSFHVYHLFQIFTISLGVGQDRNRSPFIWGETEDQADTVTFPKSNSS